MQAILKQSDSADDVLKYMSMAGVETSIDSQLGTTVVRALTQDFDCQDVQRLQTLLTHTLKLAFIHPEYQEILDGLELDHVVLFDDVVKDAI